MTTLPPSAGVAGVLASIEQALHPTRNAPEIIALREAIRTFEAMGAVLTQLAAWNNNVNGGGVELGEICQAAENLVGTFNGASQ